ncbi:tyrosine-protein phosphatase [Novosphingobium guangzhouense]|uniref:Protein-tyrosine-phosphatase n=1 Tax=Novosphingobium guangzhouense TaxID=1850347 RepID=A0A2K2G3Y8_9SPHN|nr:tyrosine-protein phosphatase [Novosphingobium guangzhouense]PNU05754.1 protein-tyrosine-phosphatase [Novosphingobium guangzhouense]
MNDRVLHLSGVHNFRDAGGYSIPDGGRMRKGAVWRSGQHHGATDADLEAIAAIGLTSVFDLRTSKERAMHPCRRPSDFAARIAFAADPQVRHAPHLAAAQTARHRTAQSTRESLRLNYSRICARPELQAMIRGWLDELASGSGPSLVNCMAGKDRTGIAVAMLHAALGVHRDDIMADYLLTNSAGDVEARIASGAETIRAITGQLDDAVLRVLMGVEAEYLETAWSAIDESHGSLDVYLEQVLEVTPQKRERLREVLTQH